MKDERRKTKDERRKTKDERRRTGTKASRHRGIRLRRSETVAEFILSEVEWALAVDSP